MLVSFLFRKTSYEKAISVLGAIVLLPVVLALVAKYPQHIGGGFALSDAFGLLAKPATLVAAFVLLCYIALESSFCNWLPPFGKEVLGRAKPELGADVVDASAQRLLSLFAIGMMAGRLLASVMPAIETHGIWYIVGTALAAGMIILVMTVTRSVRLAWVLPGLAGLVYGPIFPTAVAVAFAKFPQRVLGSLFGIIFAIGLLGAVIVPKIIGNLAKGSSIQKSLKLLLPICVILIVLALILGRL